MSRISSVCVYCGSSNSISEVYKQTAAELGSSLARQGMDLIYGGGKMGLMGILSKAVLEAGGRVIGFMPRFLYNYEGGDQEITSLHIVETMHERKQRMFEASDAFLILPGGLGTLDETFEMLTWKQLGLHKKPIILIDIEGYWNMVFNHFYRYMIEKGFVRPEDNKLLMMTPSVSEALLILQNQDINSENFVSKLS